MSESINSLFQSALDEGNLSRQAFQVLQMADIGNQIQNQIGVTDLGVTTSETILVASNIDDSGSIDSYGNTQNIIDGHNNTIDALSGSKQRNSIEFYTQYINGFVLNNWVPLDSAVRMDSNNYNPCLGTPLYDSSVLLLGQVIARVQNYQQSGQVPRSGVIIVTDGSDVSSRKSNASDVSALVDSMLADEMAIVAFLGVEDGHTDFRSVARAMGIRDNWILTTKSDASEIRRAFNMFSSSMVRASQNAGAFSQVAAGGFMATAP